MKVGLLDEISKYTPKGGNSKLSKLENRKFGDKPLFDSKYSPFVWNTIILVIIALVVGVIYISRAVSIQVTNRDRYLGLADRNRIRELPVLAERGVIFDKDGAVIARNKPSFSIFLNRMICTENGSLDTCRNVVNDIKEYINVSNEQKILDDLNKGSLNITLATTSDREAILKLESNLSKFKGVFIETVPQRDYLFGPSFAHLVGYVGMADTLEPKIEGKTGVEEAYDEYISGLSGNRVVQVDSSGTRYQQLAFKDALPGKDISLHIDAELQNVAFELLKNKILDTEDESDAEAGAIVIQDPTNGGILAMVSYPSFDPNRLVEGISQDELAVLNSNPYFPFFNRAISAAYPPGSTFKLVTASAVLMEGIADRNLTIFDNGYIQVGSFIFRNWKLDGHGEVNLVRALQVSNDTYFYTVGGGYGGIGGLGIEKLHDWAEKFGYGKSAGIDIDGEVSGFMPDGTHREWYLGDDYISSIGQGDILSTPLQVNNMTTYFANGGTLYAPKVVKSIKGVGDIKPRIINENIVSKDVYDTVREGVLAASSPGGTAYPLFDFPSRHNGIKVAGKTGTSEYIDRNGEERTHAWFSAFAPYKEEPLQPSDKPITVTVFLEGGGSGSDDAAPIAKDILDYWYDSN